MNRKKSSIKANVETSDPVLIEKLQPIIEIVHSFEGHLNYMYTGRHWNDGKDYCKLDQEHKANLMNLIRPMLVDNWLMGSGGGHIWIAAANRSCNDKYKANYQQLETDIHDRILLVIDND